jgi:ferritin-like metal-binding protein YciE
MTNTTNSRTANDEDDDTPSTTASDKSTTSTTRKKETTTGRSMLDGDTTKGNRVTKRGSSRSARRDDETEDEFDLKDAFRSELRDAKDAESQVTAFLAKLDDEVDGDQLRECIEWLREQTESHSRKLNRVVTAHLDEDPKRSKNAKPSRAKTSSAKGETSCMPVRAMIEKAMRSVKGEPSPGRDMLLITDLQKLLHYGIAVYGSLCAWSERIGDDDAVILFRRLTDEKRRADYELTRIADSSMVSSRR